MLYLAVITLSVDEIIAGSPPESIRIVKLILPVSDEDFIKDNYTLTRCEKSVLEHLIKGLQYKEIASKLFISIETVKCHIRNIYQKLNVHNRSEATIEYLKFIK